MIAYYNFDNNTSDFSGNNNNGIMSGNMQSTTDRFGNPCGALLFNGTDNYVEVPNSPSLQTPKLSLSVTCWFKISKSPVNGELKWLTLICKGTSSKETNNNPQYRVQLMQSPTQSTISLNTDLTEYDNSFKTHILEFDKWNFFAMVYDGNLISVYLNTQKIWEFPYNKELFQNDSPLQIGKDIPGNTEFFCGSLDDLKIYSSPISETEINLQFNDKKGMVFPEPFTFECSQNIYANTDKGKCYATVNFAAPLLKINCGTAQMKQISGPLSGSAFQIGTTSIAFIAEGSSGLKEACNFSIIVRDIYPPEIKCLPDTTIILKEGISNGLNYFYKLPDAIDNCGTPDIKLIDGLKSGSLFPVGKTVLTFKSTDKSGNYSECSYSVTIVKTQKQAVTDTLKCPNDIVVSNDNKKCGAVVSYVSPSLNDGNNSNIIQVKGNKSNTFFPVGITANKFIYISNKNDTLTCFFNVIVNDIEKPEIICPKDTIIYINSNYKSAEYFYETPKATDNCKIDNVSMINGIKSGSDFPIGTTVNVFKATDIYGNFSTCSFNVSVKERDSVSKVVSSTNPLPKKVGNDSIAYGKQFIFSDSIITAVMYDDGDEDGDTVSVYYNGLLIVDHEMIRFKKSVPIVKLLKLRPGEENYLISKAWNTGLYGLNTMKIDLYDGDFTAEPKFYIKKKPSQENILNSYPGTASAIILRLKN